MTQPLTKVQREEMSLSKRMRAHANDHLVPADINHWASKVEAIEQQRDLAVAKLATARVCNTCKGTTHRRTGRAYETFPCPDCTNGVQFSDVRVGGNK